MTHAINPVELAVALETQSPCSRITVTSLVQEFPKSCGHKRTHLVLKRSCRRCDLYPERLLTPLKIRCCLIWTGPYWRASREADGVLLLAGLQLKPVCVFESMCACLPGQYPRHEICVWWSLGKSRESMLSTIWHLGLLPEIELEKQRASARYTKRGCDILSRHIIIFFFCQSLCLCLTQKWLWKYENWKRWQGRIQCIFLAAL